MVIYSRFLQAQKPCTSKQGRVRGKIALSCTHEALRVKPIILMNQMVLAQWEIQLPAYKEAGHLTVLGKMFSLESLGEAPTYQAMR